MQKLKIISKATHLENLKHFISIKTIYHQLDTVGKYKSIRDKHDAIYLTAEAGSCNRATRPWTATNHWQNWCKKEIIYCKGSVMVQMSNKEKSKSAADIRRPAQKYNNSGSNSLSVVWKTDKLIKNDYFKLLLQ